MRLAGKATRPETSATPLHVLSRPRLESLFFLSAILILYANLRAYVSVYVFPLTDEALTVVSLLAAGLLLVWGVKVGGLTVRDIGLAPNGALSQGLTGLFFGCMLVLPAVVFLAFPPSVMPRLSLGNVEAMSQRELLFQIFLRMPLGTILIEEIAFRGVLFASLKRAVSVRWAIIGSSAVFTLWHVGVNYHLATSLLAPTHDAQPFFILSGLYLGVFFAGCVWCTLREMTGHLAAPMATHWVVNSAMLLVLYMSAGQIS